MSLLSAARACAIQSTLISCKFDSDFFTSISDGHVLSDPTYKHKFTMFTTILPSTTEIDKIKHYVESKGFTSFAQALEQIKFDSPETFVLRVLSWQTDLQEKARLIKMMDEVPKKANLVIAKMWEWTVVIAKIMENELLREIVITAFKFGQIVKGKHTEKGADISMLLRFFTMKSTKDSNVVAYKVVLKHVLERNKLTWDSLPTLLFPDDLLKILEHLEKAISVTQSIHEINNMADELK